MDLCDSHCVICAHSAKSVAQVYSFVQCNKIYDHHWLWPANSFRLQLYFSRQFQRIHPTASQALPRTPVWATCSCHQHSTPVDANAHVGDGHCKLGHFTMRINYPRSLLRNSVTRMGYTAPRSLRVWHRHSC